MAKIIKLEMANDFFTLGDSMLLDSGTTIMFGKIDNGDETINFDLTVRGYVDVRYKEDKYTCASNMPEELIDMFKDCSAYNSCEVEIIENNWYELSVGDNYIIVDEPKELGLSKEEIEKYILSLV